MDITIYGVSVIAVIIGLLEALKKTGYPVKYIPVTGLVLGILAGLTYGTESIQANVILGLALGLSASGLYSNGKAVKKVVDDVKEESDNDENQDKSCQQK